MCKVRSNLNGLNNIPLTCFEKEVEVMFYLEFKNISPT